MSSSTANRLIHGAGSPQSRPLIETMNPVKLPIFETVLRGINLKGSIVGTRRAVEDVVSP